MDSLEKNYVFLSITKVIHNRKNAFFGDDFFMMYKNFFPPVFFRLISIYGKKSLISSQFVLYVVKTARWDVMLSFIFQRFLEFFS